MRPNYGPAAVFAAMLLVAHLAAGQVEITESPVPDQEQTQTFDTVEAPESRSRTSGRAAVSIPLDDTGVGDWRFLNPRQPQSVSQGFVIEFENRTDRAFEVTVRVVLSLATFSGETPPPLIYDGLTTGSPGPPTGEVVVPLEDCTTGAEGLVCTASINIGAFGSGEFPYEVLIAQGGKIPANFTVRFFEEEESPARSTAYLVAGEYENQTVSPKSVATLMAVAGFGASKDPFLVDRSATSRNCPFLCPDKPYDGAERSHMTGSGRIDVTQTYGNLLDGKVSLTFKEGDLGGGDGTLDVKLSQYRFNIYSEYGVTFHYGKFQFLAPSSGIAINETGEGARLARHNYSLSRILRRESSKNVADRENRDDSLWVFEATNIGIAEFFKREEMLNEDKGVLRLFRTLSLVALQGEDRKGPEEREDPATKLKEMVFVGHEYSTYGGQINFTRPPQPGKSGAGAFYGTLSGYWSRREAKEENAPCGNALHVCDGEGRVGLLTITHPFAVDKEGKSKGNVTVTVGTGSGDDPSTPNEDEGYIGERATFAPDQIFLASFAGAISTRDFIDLKSFESTDPTLDRELKEQFRQLDIGVTGLGRGLSNKEYYGMKVVLNEVSPLRRLACFTERAGIRPSWLATLACIIPRSDIRSGATFLTFNHYRLRRPLTGSDRDAGFEADAEFNIETPRGVKINVKGGYYWPGDAVKSFIPDEAWSLSAGVSLSL